MFAACDIRSKQRVQLESSERGDTCAIGVLALIIAIVTVFQGVLAQGPGRLKASRAAIGPWARRTVTKLSLGEFRFRRTAYVPFLREFDFVAAASNRDGRGFRMPGGALGQVQKRSYPAGWYILLEELGLDNVAFELLPCQTDYLPPDIQAAPVYGEISCVVLLAAIAGCDSITIAPNGFPIARGASNQLTFREHPQLGMVAVYEEFPLKPTYFTNVSQQIHTALQLSFGVFFFRDRGGICILPELQLGDYADANLFSNGDVFLHGLRAISGECQHDECNAPIPEGQPANVLALCLLAACVPLCTRVFPSTLLKLHETVLGMLRLSECWLLDYVGIRDAIQEGIAAKGCTARWLDITLCRILPMMADRYESRTGTFSRLYPRALFSLWNSCYSWASPDRRANLDAERAARPNWVLQHPPIPNEIMILEDPLEWCSRWGKDKDSITALRYSEKGLLCCEIGFQLQELDWWLDRHGGAEAACGARTLYTATLAPENSGPEPSLAANVDGMRSLLVYRAVLMGLNLALAADNSIVCGTEFGRRVVRVL